ncbi:CBU_0592 family membrane protein [Thermomonas sp.]|jgi:paired small multidrug resistance pump|uniref:CBU_0592 family membrane protein n=1 Tax=Thermomonas sp. TaxID=1971895 RepID=UPI001AD32DF2|nr:hypothetical protein [Xanthomonadales bacterium]MBN8768022.1 hypothetical protein [Stenotrophomonas sp.]
MNLHWYDWVGLAGTALIVLSYFLLQAGRLHGNRLPYQLMNLLGAAGVLASLWGSFNISVFLLEATWAAISLYGIARTLGGRPARGA